MKIINITDKQQLNDFVGSQPMNQFLQSWQWGEFQEKVGSQIWRLGVLADNLPAQAGGLAASAVIITKDLPIGKKYLYCARGPIITRGADGKEATGLMLGEIKRLAQETGAMFFRFDPVWQLDSSLAGCFGENCKFLQTLDVQPSKTSILDLTKTEDSLLKEMHQKTRYNINLSIKKGVKIVEGDKARFEEFWSLLDQTSDRDQFSPHGRNYYEAMIELDDNPIKLFFAEYKGKPIATALIAFFGDTAAYLHGGSANEERQVMAPYLLQWHSIKLAKAGGQKYYDFYGIDESRWPGVTRFKKGFGGLEFNYPGTFDLVCDQSWYSIYKMVRKVRRTF